MAVPQEVWQKPPAEAPPVAVAQGHFKATLLAADTHSWLC